MTYIDPDLLSDENAVAEAILAGVADRIPGWEPSEGNVETAIAEAMAVISATIATLVKDEARDAYSGFGEHILQIARVQAAPAEALSTWTAADATGHTIPDGTQILLDGAAGPVAFATVGDVEIPAAATEATAVRVVALEPGVDGNGLTGTARGFEELTFISSVVLTNVSAGGTEDETIEEYADRLADRARRVHIVPIVTADFAALALDVPGVERCAAISLLDPDNPPVPGNPPSSGGHISVVPIDAAGQPVSPTVALAVRTLLAGEDRPLNIDVHTIDPEYTDLAIQITIRLEPDADETVTSAAVDTAIRDYLDPAIWALDELAPGRWRLPSSSSDRPIRHFDIATVADLVAGVAGVTACAVNGTSTVTLTGWAPLPNVTACDVSVI